jgi:hypothetical protein
MISAEVTEETVLHESDHIDRLPGQRAKAGFAQLRQARTRDNSRDNVRCVNCVQCAKQPDRQVLDAIASAGLFRCLRNAVAPPVDADRSIDLAILG